MVCRKFCFPAAKAAYPFRSQLEKSIYGTIRAHFPQQIIEINRKGLLRDNKRLELDLYFPHFHLGIEIQGPCHTRNENIVWKDYLKQKWFWEKENLRLIYVYTNNYRNKKNSLKKCVNILKEFSAMSSRSRDHLDNPISSSISSSSSSSSSSGGDSGSVGTVLLLI